MPYADPNASFDSAIRHFFRYLGDVHRLKQNPLVRRFFVGDVVPARSARVRDEAALALVHRLVREAAQRSCDSDAAAGRHEQSRCKHAIVALNLLGGESVESVARTLGVSAPHCYRLRAGICKAIAQQIQAYDDEPPATTLPALDEFRARMSHAALRIRIGDFDGAIDEYERLAQSSGSIPRKVEALGRLSTALVERGRVDRAEAALSSAERLLATNPASLGASARDIARAQTEFARWRLASERCDPQGTLDAIASAAARLAGLRGVKPDHVEELHAEVLLYLSWTLRNYGDSRAAEERALCDAASAIARVRSPRPALALEIGLIFERTRNTRILDAAQWRPARRRLEALTELDERARALGSFDIDLSAALGFVEYGAQMGDIELAWRAARYALSLARRHPNPRFVAENAVHAAEILAYTDHWQYAPRLLREVDRDVLCLARRSVRECVEALCHLRAGRHHRAWSLATAPERAADTPLYAAKMSAIAASAAEALGLHRNATELIEGAVSQLEEIRTALPLRYSYRLAAEITGDRRFGRKADDVTYLVTS